MKSDRKSRIRSFFCRDLTLLYAAVGAALLVVVSNSDWMARKPRAATTGTFTGWNNAANCPVACMENQGAVVGGKLYMIGGYYETNPKYTGTVRCDMYNPATNSWTRLADLPHAVTHAGIATDGVFIWVAGGYPLRSDGWQNFASTNVYVYDTRSNKWANGPSLPQPRGAGVMVWLNGELHFMSGVDLTRADKTDHWTLNTTIFNPTWEIAAPLPAPRNHPAAAVLNGMIYLAGGQQGINDAFPVATLFEYNPATNSWTQKANMPSPRSHNSAAAFIYGGRFCVAGGETSYGHSLRDVIAYDPPTNAWLSLPSLPSPRHSPLVQSIGNLIVAADGANPPTLESTVWVSYGPK